MVRVSVMHKPGASIALVLPVEVYTPLLLVYLVSVVLSSTLLRLLFGFLRLFVGSFVVGFGFSVWLC